MKINKIIIVLSIILIIIALTFILNIDVKAQTSPIFPINKKVLILNYDPILESYGNVRMHEYYNWNDPAVLEQQYIDTIKEVGRGIVNYQIVERFDLDEYPIKSSGYQFNDDTYINCRQNPTTCNNDTINYNAVLTKYHVCEKLNTKTIDELWLWGGPHFGYYEANMAGAGAFRTNGPIVNNTNCQRMLNIMGFNYQRSVSEMIEDFTHRTEGVLTHVFGEEPRYQLHMNTPWGKFATSNIISPGNSGCGWTHYPPNGTKDYDWNNTNPVSSNCDDWLNYPNLTGAKETFACEKWGCTGLGFKKWWLLHLPHVDSFTSNKWNNWWRYVADYESAITNSSLLKVEASCNGSTSIATIFWSENSLGPSNYVVDINDTEDAWNSTNGFWHKYVNQDMLSTIAPNNFTNAYSPSGPMPPLDPAITYYVRIFYRALNAYSPTISFISKSCSTFNIADIAPDSGPDGKVDLFDFNKVISHFGETGSIGWIRADIIKNGAVDLFDFNKLIDNFGKT